MRGLAEALGLEWNPTMGDTLNLTRPEGCEKIPGPPVPKGKEAFWYGKSHTEETKEKNRRAHLGLKKSEEEKAAKRAYKHTEAARLNITKNHVGMKGKSHTAESKQKMGAAFAGKSWKKDPVTGKRIWIGV
jgi:hypothetical protein